MSVCVNIYMPKIMRMHVRKVRQLSNPEEAAK